MKPSTSSSKVAGLSAGEALTATRARIGPSQVVDAGTYYAKAYVDADANHEAAANDAAALTVKKAANPVKAAAKAPAVKLKGKKATIKKAKSFAASKAQGKVTFAKKSGASGISVTSAGKAAVSKNLKPKTYSIKVKVSAKGNGNYSPASKTVTLKVKVKS